MASRRKSKNRAAQSTPKGPDLMFHELRGDHARFGRVLSLIGRRSRSWIEAPDAETTRLLEEAVDYVVNFQNRYHHPREDLLFERIAQRSSEHAHALSELRADHDKSYRSGQQLLRELRRFEKDRGSRSRRTALAGRLENFARGMHQHIRREDELMYSSAHATLDAADWRSVARAGATLPDPLLAPTPDRSGRWDTLAQYVAGGETEAHVMTRPTSATEAALARGTRFADFGIASALLLSRQAREATKLALATWIATMRPGLPRDWSAGVARALNEQRLACSRWTDEWRSHMGLEMPEER